MVRLRVHRKELSAVIRLEDSRDDVMKDSREEVEDSPYSAEELARRGGSRETRYRRTPLDGRNEGFK